MNQVLKRVQFSSERQTEDYNLSPNTMQSNRCSLLCVNIGQYRAEEPR